MTETTRRPPGPAKLTIPESLVGVLEATHRTGEPARLTVDDVSDPAVVQLLRYARIHCRRADKSFRLKQEPAGGATRLEFAMADKRPYPKRTHEHAEA